jgi:hypothetical protein
VVGADIVEIKAAFSWDITSNLLGQTGFFDNSAVSFHPAFKPPCFDVERKGQTEACYLLSLSRNFPRALK